MDKSRYYPNYLLALALLWIGFSVLQTGHFFYYYEQPLPQSARWAFRDWLIWFGLILGIRHFLLRLEQARLFSPPQRIALLSLLGVLCGMLQVLLIVTLDLLLSEPSRPFVEDFLHLYAKRWLQNLFIFGVLWTVIGHLAPARARDPVSVANASQAERLRLEVDDEVRWLDVDNIRLVEVAGNYVCVDDGRERHLTRSTLKSVEAMLPPGDFLRISRSCLVNRERIQSFARVSRNRAEVRMDNGRSYAVGRTYQKIVRESLGV